MTENQNVALMIEGCQRQEQASQLALYRHYYSYGMSICLRYSKTKEEAMEVLNDGFFKTFRKIDQYDTNYPFKPWLRKILIHASIDHYRKYRKQNEHNVEEILPSVQSSSYNEALDHLIFEDLIEIMQALPPAYKMVFNLFVIDGMSHQEIATQLNTTVGTSKSNLAKARRKIKKLLVASHNIHLKP